MKNYLNIYYKNNLIFYGIVLVIAILLGSIAAFFPNYLVMTLVLLMVSIIGILGLFIWRPRYAIFSFILFWPIYPLLSRITQDIPFNKVLHSWQELAILVIALILYFHYSQFKNVKMQFQRIDWLVVSIMGIGVYSALLSKNFSLIIYGFHLSYTPVLMYFLARFLPIKMEDILKWINWLLIISLIVALIGIYIYFTDPRSFYLKMVDPGSLAAFSRSGKWRMASILGNPLYFGVFAALSSIISLAKLMFQSRNNLGRLFWLCAFIIFTACTWWSISRAAWVMLFVGGGIIIWKFIPKQKKNWPLYIAMLLVIIWMSLTYVIYNNAYIYHLLSDSFGNFLLQSRYSQWGSTWEAIKQAPWGYGLGVGHAQLRTSTNALNVEIYDGWYLKVLAESGILGLIVFITFLTSLTLFLFKMVKRYPTGDRFFLNISALSCLIGFSFAAIGSNVWEYYFVPSLIWLFIGLVVSVNIGSLIKPSKRQIQPNQSLTKTRSSVNQLPL